MNKSASKPLANDSPGKDFVTDSPYIYKAGRVAEWFKAPVLKTGRGFRSLVSSNLTPSAKIWNK